MNPVHLSTPTPPAIVPPLSAPLRSGRMTSGDGEGRIDTIRVFLVDDHTVVRHGVRAVLEQAGGFQVVGEAGSAAEAVPGILAAAPDLALVDIRLGDGNGIQVIREVRSGNAAIRCLVLTSFADEDAFFQSVVSGAAGYVVKDVAAGELVATLRTAATGESLIRRELLDELRARETELSQDVEDELLADLTAQERRVLGFITDGMTNREIAHELDLAEKTIRNYVSNILAKVGMKNRTQLASYVARQMGRSSRSVQR